MCKPRLWFFPFVSLVHQITISFEEIKGGVIKNRLDLSKKEFFVCGKLPSSDIQMLHPTISRRHAVI